MTKKEFLEKLEHKLHLLKRDEIQDILDEYSGYIDNKLQEGKTEDEAVADFGNLDDLAREILSAYKIDAKYTRDSSRDIIDNVVNVMTQGIDSAVSYFTQHFNDLSMEAVIRLIALIFDRPGRRRSRPGASLLAGPRQPCGRAPARRRRTSASRRNADG